MKLSIRRYLTFANVASAIALFVALGGAGAYASGLIGAKDIKTDAIRSRHIKAGQVKTSDLAAPQAVRDAGLVDTSGTCPGGSNDWENYIPAEFARVGYYRDPQGRVHLSGAAINCASATGTILTLPPGYRPPHITELVGIKDVDGTATPAPIKAINDGEVFPGDSYSPNDTYSLDGISFRCAPSGQDGCP